MNQLVVPSDQILKITTPRLNLEPILHTHAEEMCELLSSPELYFFIPQEPPVLADLKIRYKKWETRASASHDELWLNWAARGKSDSRLIGHFQIGYKFDQSSASACTIAYTVAKEHQRKGYAFEALEAMLTWLRQELKPARVRAWVDTRNRASISLLEKLDFKKVELLKDADFFKGQSSDEFIYERRL